MMSNNTKEEYKSKILKLIRNKGRNEKYLRNLTLYTETPIGDLDDANRIIGYYNTYSERTSLVSQNIIQSTISALVAKLAEHARARPFVNTINGNFRDKQVSRAMQQYFDITFDEQNVYKTVSDCFRDACIFDTGYIYINVNEEKVQKLYPWQVYFDSNELKYGQTTKVAIVRNKYPSVYLNDNKIKEETVTYIEYWDIIKHKHIMFCKENTYWKEEDYEPNELPIIRLSYEEAVNGGISSTSVVDLLYGIQKTVNELYIKLGKSIRANPVSMTLVPTNSAVKTEKLTNEVAKIVEYEPVLGASGGVQQITPDLCDPQVLIVLNQLKEDAYNLVGISELSVTGQRNDIDDMSGVAIKTAENIEADRFTTQIHKIIRLYVDIARKIINIMPDKKQILPDVKERLDFTWKQIRKSVNNFKIQFSAASNLSKDPSEKWKILKEWKAEGLIPASRVPGLLEIPDLEEAASFAANSYNAIQTVIEDCIENDVYEVPPYISREDLKPEIMNTCLALKALGPENNDDIKKLMKLFNKVCKEEAEVGRANQIDEANEMLDTEANTMDEQSAFMEMQTQQMTSIAQDLQNGVIDVDQANNLLSQLGGDGQYDFGGV